MGGTGLNLGGVTDAKTSERKNNGAEDPVVSTSVDQIQAMHVVIQPQMPVVDDRYRNGGQNNLTAQNTTQESALRSLGPVNALNPNGPNLVGAAAEAAEKTATVGAQLQKISKMGQDQTVAANMTPVAPAPSIPAPTMGGGSSYSTSRKKDRDGGYTMWMPSASPDPVMAAATFSAAPAVTLARNDRLQTYGGQRMDMGAVNGTSNSLSGVTDTKGIGLRIGQTGANINLINATARLVLADSGRENKGPAVAYKPPTPVSSAPSVPTGMV